MTEYHAKLRYYPTDPLVEIKKEDLKGIETKYGVKIDYKKIENRVLENGLLMEETMDKPLDKISQEVITVSSEKKDNFRDCIIGLYEKYRCPRTAYSLMGSNEAGWLIARRLMDDYGGW
jgi:hypothetical protein